MALYQVPLDAILESVENQNKLDLVKAEYVFSDSASIPEGANGENTSLTITAKDLQSTYDGSVKITYTRLDLADLATLVPTTIRGFGLDTILKVATRLNTLYGTNFTADDFVDGPSGLVDDSGVVTLTAKATSRGWIGSVDITVSSGARPLSDFLTTTRLPGLSYPSPRTDKPYAAAYSYWRNFTPVKPALDTVQAGTGQIDVVRDALTTITGDTWSSTVAGRFSVMGAKVLYAGATTGRDDINDEYASVIIVELDETNSVGFSGSLYLHYDLIAER